MREGRRTPRRRYMGYLVGGMRPLPLNRSGPASGNRRLEVFGIPQFRAEAKDFLGRPGRAQELGAIGGGGTNVRGGRDVRYGRNNGGGRDEDKDRTQTTEDKTRDSVAHRFNS